MLKKLMSQKDQEELTKNYQTYIETDDEIVIDTRNLEYIKKI